MTDSRGNPHPLRQIPGGKHDAGDVERIPDPAFRVDGLCSLSPEDADVRMAERSVDSGTILDDRSRAEGGSRDSSEGLIPRARLRRKPQDQDVPDPLPPRRDEFYREPGIAESFGHDFARTPLDETLRKVRHVGEMGAETVEGEIRIAPQWDHDLPVALRDSDAPVDETFGLESTKEFARPMNRDNRGPHRASIVRPMFHPLPRYLYESPPASPRIMRAAVLAIAFLLAGIAVLPSSSAEDFGAVSKVNKLIGVHSTPELAPGESGVFEFELNVTYAEEILDVTLNVSIYRYATIEESVPVDAAWPYAYPYIDVDGTNVGREREWTFSSLNDTTLVLNFTVVTHPDSHEMPHGSVFSQSSYFVRFYLTFTGNVSGSPESFVMASRGYFTDAQWEEATSDARTDPCNAPSCRGNLNLTVLGVDGILPDSAFGVKEPIPRWPFYALIVGAVFFLALAFLFWVEENPGSYPRVEAWWARTRGRLARTFAPWRQRKPRKM